MKLQPVEALGQNLDELRELLGLTERANIQVEENGTYAEFRHTGIAALIVKKRISTIFLYADGVDGYQGYRGDLGKLRINSSKQMVRFLFGQPSVVREDIGLEVLGTPLIHDRYDYAEYSYHFQYDHSGKRLELLTIMSADSVQRLGK